MLLSIGDLSRAEIEARFEGAGASRFVDDLVAAHRVLPLAIGAEERFVAIEDAARFKDALGIEIPAYVPQAFLAPVRDALGDLVSRYARTHGPFDADALARRLALPVAAVREPIARLIANGRLVEGAFTPGKTGEHELSDADVLRRIKARSLTKLRRAIEPVPKETLAAFAVAHHRVLHPGRGEAAILSAVEDLEGLALPVSVLLGDVLPARVKHFSPFELDGLTARGEVVWCGIEPLGTWDARIALFTADRFAALAPVPRVPANDLEKSIVRVLESKGAIFFRDIERALGGFTRDLERALWSLVFAGVVTNDTLAPLRGRLAKRSTSRERPRRGPAVRPRSPVNDGRWTLLPTTRASSTDRGAALAKTLLRRHGVLSREAVLGEGAPGGYGAVYPLLRAMEEAGKVRRGYFVAGIAAMQFAMPGADDRLRAIKLGEGDAARAVMLASTEPANVYGAALPWPRSSEGADVRFERSAGTHVIVRRGRLLAFIGRGNRSLFTAPGGLAEGDAEAIATLLRGKEDTSGPVLVERIDGEAARSSPLAAAFTTAGFVPSGAGGLLAFAREPR